MRYLLDTDICVHLLRGKQGIKEKIEQVGIKNCFISEITVAELKYGAEKSDNREKHSQEVEEVEELFTVLPIYPSFDRFALEKVTLQKQGILIPDFDLLIGATAVANQLTMVTNNEKHLNRIQGIRIENWVTPS
ncbi:type II toxin-antitoxin system VapC family toxin [Tunicatimonas pelagia]|uniref:type II toxin-antitoxin system VapC family toxin n=1 Tax=Tunicatimonas pelagia TaxID=931531 RepID=UPI002666C45E|nr:type II toxin-antitoxin system VapC family toxin [Tunicatimonas pelagia]WKN44738.1 type II toxin-antitoxin system VapC family toxin [Tunicatimonas pelagia]